MKSLYYLFVIVFISSCSSLKTSYDFDKTTDFSSYKTYAFSEDAMKLPIQELNRNRLLNAIDQQMTAKGFTKSSDPDVLIDLHVKAEQKKDATATTTGPGMYGGYGAPWRYGYGAGFSTTQINVNEYTEGTLFVNMVDKNADKLVWQGRATKVLDEDASPEKREKNINEAVAKIFEKYPPQN